MKRVFLVMVFLVVGVLNLRAQDRIYRLDGEVVDCKLLSSQATQHKMLYARTDEEAIERFMPCEEIDYIEVAGVRMVRNIWGKYEALNRRFKSQMPAMKSVYSVYGSYWSGSWSAAVSYGHFFTRTSGLVVEAEYWRSREGLYSSAIGLMPKYEARAHLQGISSILFMQVGFGMIYHFDACQLVAKKEPYDVIAMPLQLAVGMDIRLSKGCYLDMAAKLNWRLLSKGVGLESGGYDTTRSTGGTKLITVGVALGLRFGREH